jgi:GNAT superfamily N-acetyltransferase
MSCIPFCLPVAGNSASDMTPRFHITRLDPEHEADLAELLIGLDAPSRQCRFNSAVNGACLSRHARHALSASAFIAGAFVEGRLSGAVEVYDARPPELAEVAFVVAQNWRRRGIASALLWNATQWAFETGRGGLRMVFSRSNWAMRKLAEKADARLDLIEDGMSAEVLARPNRPSQPARDPFWQVQV